MHRRTVLSAMAGAGTALLAGCASVGGSGTPPPAYDVGMLASAFDPARFETSVGSTVVWRNTDARIHTVTAYERTLPEGAAFFASGGFETETAAREGYTNGLKGSLASGDTFEHTFEVAGEYPYFCVPHERGGMVGTIVVRG